MQALAAKKIAKATLGRTVQYLDIPGRNAAQGHAWNQPMPAWQGRWRCLEFAGIL